MRIGRAVAQGLTRYGTIADDMFETLAVDGDLSSAAFIEGRAWEATRGDRYALADIELLAPVVNPRKVIGIGLNYVDHAAESHIEMPQEPLVFAKFPSAIVGPGTPIAWDSRLTDAVDFEAELAVVIGRRAKGISVGDALEHVFAYTCLNDISARDLQFSDGQWVRSKSLDSFCPIGPWLVTAEEIEDPQTLAIECVVSGEVFQQGSTQDMHFGVAELIAKLSRSFVLEPGDVIATGTPPGVGWFRSPRRMLREGDEVQVSIQGIGSLTNPIDGDRGRPEPPE